MAKVRLVAYRKATSSSTLDSTYELDLQKAPDVSLNFQFADIKEPEKRKANYSQTFKLPFTKKNNEFFQDWFNVNIETLVFDTRTRFNATLYVGTIPQFEGVMQLRSVYQKAGLYEVVLMSSAADLFTNIGSSKLRDVFLLDDGTYSFELNHNFNADNIEKSWDGSATDFYAVNSDGSQGASLRDSVAGVQKVMYPLSVTKEAFFYNEDELRYLRMPQAVIDLYSAIDVVTSLPSGLDYPPDYMTRLTQLRPAVQIKELVKLIIAKAGFSYKSTFLDSTYFGKLFMTTANYLSVPAPAAVQTAGAQTGVMSVGNDEEWGVETFTGSSTGGLQSLTTLEMIIPANTTSPQSGYATPSDPNSVWNAAASCMQKTDNHLLSVTVRFRTTTTNVLLGGSSSINPTTGVPTPAVMYEFRLVPINPTTGLIQGDDQVVSFGSYSNSNGGAVGYVESSLPLDSISTGQHFQIKFRAFFNQVHRTNNSGSAQIKLGGCKIQSGYTNCDGSGQNLAENGFSNMYNEIRASWQGYGTNVYNQKIDIPACIDPQITQKAFLKDLIERFNLVILPDPDDQTELLIEPYDDFISSGGIKYWTDKLDLDKEIVLKDTTSIQKRSVEFADLPDIDLMNKSIAEHMTHYNPYGKQKIIFDNDWTSGVLKNNPIFSPFITQQVFVNANVELGSQCPVMSVQYEYTYKWNSEESGYENIVEPTKPKLFYYSGTPTAFTANNDQSAYFMHYQLEEEWVNENPFVVGGLSSAYKAKTFTTFPKCSPYEISSTGYNQTSSRSLYWSTPPLVNASSGSFNSYNNIVTDNSLYFTYWRNYLNSIYDPDARIMECHLNLNEVDIFNFSFSDEIFIKDSYWRILEITNYQVGVKSSCKVKLLKVLNNFDTSCPDCGDVIGQNAQGENTGGGMYFWCPETNPDCSPTPALEFLTTTQVCCECAGGNWLPSAQVCFASAGSLSVKQVSENAVSPILQVGLTKNLASGKIAGRLMPFIRGANNNKYSKSLMRYMGDDIVIKYQSGKGLNATPYITGESHRMVLTGFTVGNTRGYAYPNGETESQKLTIPVDTNMVIRVKGICTVIGGTSSTYTLGNTEAFAYYTAFKNVNNTITQVGTAGGVIDFQIKESGGSTTATLYIDANSTTQELRFGLDDSQTDTQRTWQLSVELDVNKVNNMQLGFFADIALYQNLTGIQLQNYDQLLWN